MHPNRRACMQAAKQRSGAVTSDGLRFARRSAARTAAQVLGKLVAHHVRETTQEAEIAEASEYRDEIKASIKAWAFQVRPASSSTCPRLLAARGRGAAAAGAALVCAAGRVRERRVARPRCVLCFSVLLRRSAAVASLVAGSAHAGPAGFRRFPCRPVCGAAAPPGSRAPPRLRHGAQRTAAGWAAVVRSVAGAAGGGGRRPHAHACTRRNAAGTVPPTGSTRVCVMDPVVLPLRGDGGRMAHAHTAAAPVLCEGRRCCCLMV